MTAAESRVLAYIGGLRLRREKEYARRVWHLALESSVFWLEQPAYMSSARCREIRRDVLRMMEEKNDAA